MISFSVKKQGQDYQKLHENRPLALFRNTPPLAAGVLYSLWVTFPAACGVSPGHDQLLRQEARPRLPEAPREPPIGSLPKYPAACGGDPLLTTKFVARTPNTESG